MRQSSFSDLCCKISEVRLENTLVRLSRTLLLGRRAVWIEAGLQIDFIPRAEESDCPQAQVFAIVFASGASCRRKVSDKPERGLLWLRCGRPGATAKACAEQRRVDRCRTCGPACLSGPQLSPLFVGEFGDVHVSYGYKRGCPEILDFVILPDNGRFTKERSLWPLLGA